MVAFPADVNPARVPNGSHEPSERASERLLLVLPAISCAIETVGWKNCQ